jgi:hypothetical protein
MLALLLASAVPLLSKAATAEPVCSSSAARLSYYFSSTPCIGRTARALLIDAGRAQPEHSSSTDTHVSSGTAAEPLAGPANIAESFQKPLAPVSKSDVAVFVLAGFVLFIAAGTGEAHVRCPGVQSTCLLIVLQAHNTCYGHQ